MLHPENKKDVFTLLHPQEQDKQAGAPFKKSQCFHLK